MFNKKFSERLNRELDSIGMPEAGNERIDAFAKLVKIPKFQAQALLNGATIPNELLLDKLAKELEVNAEWLLGKSDSKETSH